MRAKTFLVDSYQRTIRDLRISVTDRCNFRCLYCLPETEAAANFYRSRWNQNPGIPIHHQWKPKHEILSFEEIERTAQIAVACGIEKIRLTGGEPLLRQNIATLIQKLARIPGIRDLAMTTNGFLFPKYAIELREAGLHRVSFSLDSFDKDNFKRLTGVQGLAKVTRSVQLAKELGFDPIKVNAVIIRDINDHEIEGLCQYALDEQISVRFIEFMPLDSSKAWQNEHVFSGNKILARLQKKFDLTPTQSANASETAKRWQINGAKGEVGIIAPVTEPFCGHCNRLRLTSDGQIRTCLFSLHEHDLKPLLRGKASDEDIAAHLQSIVYKKEAGHKIGREDFVQPTRTMSCIGG
ncbi:MAG: GTP 3',8-cyclase 2 [Verrucomicrobia subdivision 3 bacterium]|nr:GTP 3',8-cyclase 2 [Limisphaerales bacterium]MCS1414407.1 GTP 3',8-cyclase 2 [Limisphaerales bacterium]